MCSYMEDLIQKGQGVGECISKLPFSVMDGIDRFGSKKPVSQLVLLYVFLKDGNGNYLKEYYSDF